MMSKKSVIYQLVTDRFDNDSGTLHERIHDHDYNERFGDFLGGTFRGIMQRLDHISGLGVTHILISPVQECRYYHGYNFDNSFAINRRFGSEHDLEALVDECHRRGIGVIMDYVSTHVSSRHPLFLENAVYGSDKELDRFLFVDRMRRQKKFRPYYDEIVYKLTSGRPHEIASVNRWPYLGYFGLEEYPLLNLEHPKNVEFHKKVLKHWITSFGFDAVRFDSGFIQPRNYLRAMQDFLSTIGDVDVLAEYWGFEVSHGQGYGYSGGDCYGFCNGEFDIGSTLEFNFRSGLPEFFSKVIKNYYHFAELQKQYRSIVSLNNHDIPRFRGGRNMQKILATLKFTLPSIPMLYYGDEIGMEQYNDGRDRVGQSRDPMRFDIADDDMLNFYRTLVRFRRENDFDDHQISDVQINDAGALMTYRVHLDGRSYLVFLNKEDRAKPVDCSALFDGPKAVLKDILTGESAGLGGIILDGESARVLEELGEEVQQS